MKTKLKILNFIMWILGLDATKTGLVQTKGKRFKITEYRIEAQSTPGKTDRECIEALNKQIKQSGAAFIINNGLVTYEIERKKDTVKYRAIFNILN